ncbi:hypothetical protein [Tenacibaculum sp. SZ-18]|uniref:hypothetical protein n=1 Tax=Tenacibaculum sp. SZ-18 TaxID=754423 RepID=UPI000C2CF249|nr:hypothetical protein [Tenacibaculum sp. SZ-18]
MAFNFFRRKFYASLFFRASIKLFIKNTIANMVLTIIITTLITARLSPRSKAPVRGFTRPNKINKVNKTAMCAITLFSFLTPLFNKNKITPIIAGIIAVIEGVSEEKYPQEDKTISNIAFNRLA